MNKYIFLLAIMVSLLFSCNDTKVVQQEDILVKFGERYLTKEQVASQIPDFLTGTDSIRMADALVKDWINTKLISKVAMRNVRDEKRINELVKKYRENLIIEQYMRNMIMENQSLLDVEQDSMINYYNANRENLKLSSPIVKGRFVKIASTSSGADKLKHIFKSDREADRDSMEKILAMEATMYVDFYDRWTALERIQSMLPYDLGDSDISLKDDKYIAITDSTGFMYLLYISDYLCSNDIMPYEYAKERIREIFIAKNQREYDVTLRGMLYDEAVNDGELELFNKKLK
ncbi:MAG: hypothetical protein R3Y22_02540 [Bacteroidales bacterium]